MTVVTGFVVEGSARRLIPILVGFTRLRGYRQCDGFQIEEPESQLQQYVAKHCCGAAAMVSLRGSRGNCFHDASHHRRSDTLHRETGTCGLSATQAIMTPFVFHDRCASISKIELTIIAANGLHSR